MGTLSEQAAEYFKSINPLAHKIAEDIRTIQDINAEEWDDLTAAEQDLKLDDYFLPGELSEKYKKEDESEEPLPECFPKLRVNCGEKIVVDFDNDGWTWRDEHSGPFSWMTRSQQDLQSLDFEDEGLGKETTKPKLPSVPPRNTRKSRSPKPDGVKTGLERSIWESPFLTADRGLDSGYPSSHTSEHSKSSAEDAEDKLSLTTLGTVEEQRSPTHVPHNEDAKLLNESADSFNTEIWVPSEIHENGTDSDGRSSASPNFASNRISKTHQKKASGFDQPLMNELELAIRPPSIFADNIGQGQISPVFIADAGETSTEDVITHQPVSRLRTNLGGSSFGGGQVNLALDESTDVEEVDLEEWKLPSITDSGETQDQPTSTTKSGFDFLDNW